MDFSEKLQKLRQDKNMTQEQLAEQLFVSRTAISKWESGRGYPSIDSLKAISKWFSISIDELLSGDELITIAETKNKETVGNIKTMIFGILDCMAVLILFLPLFGQQGIDRIETVSLLALHKIPLYIKVPYLFLTGATALWGVLLLALQACQNRVWRKASTLVSLILSILAVTAFVLSRQPYAAVLVFFTLLLKGLLLIKQP